MRSILPLLKEKAAALRVRVQAADATLDLLRDLGMYTKEHEHSTSYLHVKLAAIEQDIAILEKGYALKETHRVAE